VTAELWGATAVAAVLACLYGRALSVLGASSPTVAPAVGFAVELIVADLVIQLPGRAVSAVVVLLVLGLVSLVVCLRGPRPSLSATPVLVLAVAVFGASVPFISSGRVGLLGVSLDNDTSYHLLWADALHSSAVAHLRPDPTYYPLAPHSLADALATGLGIRLDIAFDAFSVATVVIMALIAAAALRGESWWRRTLTAAVVAFFYLVAAYFGEDSFKEVILALFLLAFVLQVEDLRTLWGEQTRRRWAPALPLAVLVAGGIYVFGYLAAAWFAATLGIWIAAELVSAPRVLRTWRGLIRDYALAFALPLVALIVLLAPLTNRLLSLFSVFGVSPAAAIPTSNIGNLAGPLPGYEGLGIWRSTDFRFMPANVFHAGEFAAFALAILVFGLLWSLARRRFVLPAALGACALIYLHSTHGQSAYVAAKSLVIAGPVIGLCGMRGLLETHESLLPRSGNWLRALLGVVFAGFALSSSLLALRDSPVYPTTPLNELETFARPTVGSTVLFLGDSDYAAWVFDRSSFATPAASGDGLIGFTSRLSKPIVYGEQYDWDNVETADLNHFRWVITSSSDFQSQAPGGFRLVRRLAMYELWKRIGTVSPREAVDTPGNPGAVLGCATRSGRRISRERGVAATMTTPVGVGLSALEPGGSETVSLKLPAGRWQLSLSYLSGVPIELDVQGHRFTISAYLDRPGVFFAVGELSSVGGSVLVTLDAEKPSFLTGIGINAQLSELIATRLPDTRALIPLRRACGRYVDWYRTDGPR
jgi:hypothetical protein